MKILYIIVLSLMNVLTASADLYSDDEIGQIIGNEKTQGDARLFIKSYLSSKQPESFLDKHLKTSQNPLIKEYQLYSLLKEISRLPPHESHKSLIEQLKNYPTNATKMHEEGNLEIAIFNIHAKAVGIENSWIMHQSNNYYSELFNKQPLQGLAILKQDLNQLSRPKWQGLKTSIAQLNENAKQQISRYFINQPENIRGLDKYVSRFALITNDQALTKLAIKHTNQSNAEFILRQMPKYFQGEFVTKQLLLTSKTEEHKNFALALMRPYVDSNVAVKEYLLTQLADESAGATAAFALSTTQNIQTVNQLIKLYQSKTSKTEQNHIVLALKMNPLPEAQQALKRVQLNPPDNSGLAKWLNSFEGEK
ncbi:MAG: hypothetical protein L3J52_06365 [Proteobacteria bacterium]|nr:hypothetical protein [Pseudomonadota bacterium]